MADVIQLILTAKNDASKTISQIEKDIKRLEKAGNGTPLSGLDKGMAAIGTGFAIGAFGATIAAIVDGTAQLSQAGANVDRLRYSFESLAAQHGTSGNQILTAIDSVTQGTLSQQQMMMQANAAMLLGVADTADEFETLAKIAVDRGRAMGISMEYAFESIVKGVGRMSPLILDNLGIVIDADTTYANYAKTLGKTADALSDVEKRQALISKLKVEVADFDTSTVNDAASAWEKLTAAQANAAAAAGNWINTNAGAIDTLDILTIYLDKIAGKLSSEQTVKLKGLNAELARLQEHDVRPALADFLESLKQTDGDSSFFGLPTLDKLLRDLNEESVQKVKAEIKELQDMMNEDWKTANMGKILPDPAKAAELAAELAAAAEETKTIEEYTKRVSAQMGEGKEAAAALVRETIDTAGSLQNAIPALNNLVDGLRQAKEEAKAMNSAISGATSGFDSAVMGAFEDSGFDMDVIAAAKTARVAFDEALVSIENAGYSLYDTEAAAMMAEAQFSESFLGISQAVDEATRSIGGAKAKTVQLSEEFQNLQGIVEGLLSTATQDIGGLDLEAILPREDAISENARRLAAIASEGLIDQPWLDEFKNEAPGTWADLMLKVARGTDVKTAAAELLRDFQNGLKPELIDKDKLKEIAKRMFQVDQSTKAMVDEIATELANEMNISIEDAKALVGSAAGVKPKLTDEEKQKIVDEKLAGLEAKVGFKFDTKENVIKSGVDSGVLNADGVLEIPATVKVSATNAGFGPGLFPVGLGAPEDGGGTQEVDTSAIAAVEIPTALKFDATALDAQIQEFNDSKALTTAITFTFDIDNTQVAASAMNSFAVWANAFAAPENVSTFSSAFGGVVFTAITERSADYTLAGVTVSMGVFSGFQSTSIGTSIADEISKQLTDNAAKIEQSGQTVGRTWGKGFLDVVGANVPLDLVNILVDLVTPEVLAEVRKQQGMEGAK